MDLPKKFELKKPWGGFMQFCHNEKVTVKILHIKPGSKLSLQYHQSRDEFWYVIEGTGTIVLDDKQFNVVAGDECFIRRGQKHRIVTTGSGMRVLEVSYGDFDEKDIIRLEDSYGREGTNDIH